MKGYTFFLILILNIDCGFSLEPPRRGGFNACISTIIVLSKTIKDIILSNKIFNFYS